MADWATAPLHRAHEAVNEIDRVLHLSRRGITQIAHSVPLVEALLEVERVRGTEGAPAQRQRRIDAARREAEFAQREVEHGYPVLHAHATVALWTTLEVGIEDLVLVHLEHEPKYLAKPALGAIRIPVAEYEQLDRLERLRLLLNEFSRSSKAEFKQGVTRFETVLALIDLSGGIDEDTRRRLFEHQQVRNVIVHRASIVDRRFKEQCPWLRTEAGQKLELTHEHYETYRKAVDAYFIEIMHRMIVAAGHTREEAERRIAEAMANPTVPPDDALDDPPNPPIQQTSSAGG